MVTLEDVIEELVGEIMKGTASISSKCSSRAGKTPGS